MDDTTLFLSAGFLSIFSDAGGERRELKLSLVLNIPCVNFI